ncbi:MAG: hypothetical protein OHK0039_04500 [Bacteroidia bacterium]
MVPTDFSEASAQALRYAAQIARVWDTTLTLMYVASGATAIAAKRLFAYAPPQTSALRRLEDIIEQAGATDVKVQLALTQGGIPQEYLIFAQRHGVDALMLGVESSLPNTIASLRTDPLIGQSRWPVWLVPEQGRPTLPQQYAFPLAYGDTPPDKLMRQYRDQLFLQQGKSQIRIGGQTFIPSPPTTGKDKADTPAAPLPDTAGAETPVLVFDSTARHNLDPDAWGPACTDPSPVLLALSPVYFPSRIRSQ